MGEADVILSIRIKCEDKSITITQSHYIEKILKKFKCDDCCPLNTPLDPTIKLMHNIGRVIDQLEYSRAIGCLMYAMTSTRLEIAYDVAGWVFLLGGGAISRASKKQPYITDSTMEAEFVADKEAMWLRNLIHEILLSGGQVKLSIASIHVAPISAHAGQQIPSKALATHTTWELKTLFAQQAEHELLQTVREFYACQLKEGQSLHYNMHGTGKTVNELYAMLKLHEQTLPKKDAPTLHVIRVGKVEKKNNKNKKPQLAAREKNQGKKKFKLAYAPKPKILPPPKKENPTKDSIYHQCSDTGRWKWNCPQYLSKLLKTKKLSRGASTSGIFTIEFFSFPGKSWVYDTGCGIHIYNTTQGRGSRKLKPRALSLYMGNGQHAAAEAIGYYHLCFPSGLVVILHNCHYAPSITRGFILVSRLYDNGFINRFDDYNTILVSRNNVVYFSVVPRDGIYEIDLSNSNTNDSSICNIMDFSHQEIDEGDQEIDEPESDIIPICRSTRARHALDRMCLYIDDEEHELGDLNEPANYKAALLDPESDKWLDAMNVELQSMKDNKVWDLVNLPPNDKTAGSKWLFKKKTDMDGVVHTYNARLVANGFTQTYEVDYGETFSPVIDIRAIRILIAIDVL
nr:hypothetical protein [Tanacetum cinerariifolium]